MGRSTEDRAATASVVLGKKDEGDGASAGRAAAGGGCGAGDRGGLGRRCLHLPRRGGEDVYERVCGIDLAHGARGGAAAVRAAGDGARAHRPPRARPRPRP